SALYGSGVPRLCACGFGVFGETAAGFVAGAPSGGLGAGVGAGAGAGGFGAGGCGSGPSLPAARAGATSRAARARSTTRWVENMVSPVLLIPWGRQVGRAAFGKACRRPAGQTERAPHGYDGNFRAGFGGERD